MTNKVKILLIKIIVLTTLAIGPLMLFDFIIDPYQFYRIPSIYQQCFNSNQRIQNPGLAKNYEAQTLIIGTSMTENFSPEYIGRVLSSKTLKLSISGGSAYEQNLILNVALNNKDNIKNIIWGLDYGSLKGEINAVDDSQFEFPYYLYDKNPLNDYKYLINISTLRESSKVLLDNDKYNHDLLKLNTWGDNLEFSKAAVQRSYKNMVTMDFDSSLYNVTNMKNNFDANILPIIKQNPDINFYMYFPPYSILHYKFFMEKDLLDDLVLLKEYAYEQTENISNFNLYDYQMDYDLIYNLDNYKDTAHHNSKINDFIIDKIVAGEYMATDAYPTKLKEWEQKIRE